MTNRAFFYPESIAICAITPGGTVVAQVHLVDPTNYAGLIVSFVITLCPRHTATHGKSLVYLGTYDPETNSFVFPVHRDKVVFSGVLHRCGMATINKFWNTEAHDGVEFLHHYLNSITESAAKCDPLHKVCVELSPSDVQELLTFFDDDFDFSQSEINLCQKGHLIDTKIILGD